MIESIGCNGLGFWLVRSFMHHKYRRSVHEGLEAVMLGRIMTYPFRVWDLFVIAG